MRLSKLHNLFASNTYWKQSNVVWKTTPSSGSRTGRKGRSTVAEGFRLVIGSVSSLCALSFLSSALSCGIRIVYPLFALCFSVGRVADVAVGVYRFGDEKVHESLSRWIFVVFAMFRCFFLMISSVFEWFDSRNEMLRSNYRRFYEIEFISRCDEFDMVRLSTAYGD